jgi:hypothetical protein
LPRDLFSIKYRVLRFLIEFLSTRAECNDFKNVYKADSKMSTRIKTAGVFCFVVLEKKVLFGKFYQ